MKHLTFLSVLSICCFLASCGGGVEADPNEVELIYTTDIHGEFIPYNFLCQEFDSVGVANISSYVSEARKADPEGVILLDGGDLVEGTPPMYFYNYEAVREPHLSSRIINYMKYDALCVGNHDLESGESVYADHLRRDYQMPWLAANAIDTRTGESMFEPYCMIERKGRRIAILGLITSETDQWLPRAAIPHLHFISMLDAAKRWIPIIEEREHPDMIIGLFHAGHEEVVRKDENGEKYKDGAMLVAQQVRGFDLVLLGHDHLNEDKTIVNDFGDSVRIAQPLAHADEFATVRIRFEEGRKANQHARASFTSEIHNTKDYPFDEDYLKQIVGYKERIDQFLDRPVGNVSETLNAESSLVGPSNLIDLIHVVQLYNTNADISFVSCLSNFTNIESGDLTMRQLFSIYKYDNLVTKMWMYGHEVKRFLEYGYGRQFNQMKSPDDHLLAFKYSPEGDILMGRFGPELVTPQYNFTQAAGINYVVDVRKPVGERVTIESLADGRPFDMNQKYFVALSSHQASGGGGFLPYGLEWNSDDCEFHTVTASVKDMRCYISEFIRRIDSGQSLLLGSWRVEPYEWWLNAKQRDIDLLTPYLKR